jgi:hypothetical protein
MDSKRNDNVPVQMQPDFFANCTLTWCTLFPQTGLCQQSYKLQAGGEVPQVR